MAFTLGEAMTHRSPEPTIDALMAHEAWVRRLARRLVSDPARADDVVQDSWLRALRSPPAVATDLRGWWSRVVRSVVREQRRGDERRRRRELASRPPTPPENTEAIVQRVHRQQDLVHAVLELAPRFRDVVLLRYFEDLSVPEIAQRQGIPVGTAESRLHRAIDKLRRSMDRDAGRAAWATLLGAGAGGPPSGGGELTPAASVLAMPTILGGVLMASMAVKTALVVGTLGLASYLLWPSAEHPSEPGEFESRAHVFEDTAETSDAPREADAGRPRAVRSELAEGSPEGGRADANRPPALVLDVTRRGQPAAGRVLVHDDQQTLGPLELKDGRAIFTSPDSPAGSVFAFVLRDAGLPERHALPGFVGAHSIELDPGRGRLSVDLLVDGSPPREPVPFLLESDVGLDWIAQVSDEVRRRLRWPFQFPRTRLRLWTDERGTRSLDALPQSWSGTLLPSPRHVLVEVHGAEHDGSRVRIPAPGARVRMELRAIPAIHGQVVDAQSHEPLGAAQGNCWIAFADGSNSPVIGFACEADGRFAVVADSANPQVDWTDPDQWIDFHEVRLWIEHGGTSTEFQFLDDDLDPSGELGVLEIQPGRALEFVVEDASGAPIAGAMVLADGARGRSDATGRGQLESIGKEVEWLEVGARGHHSQRVPVPAAGSGPARFVLHRSNELEIRVRSTQGLPDTVGLRLRSGPGLFPADPAGSLPVIQRCLLDDGIFRSCSFGADHLELRLRAPEDGVVTLHELAVGQPFRLELHDRLGGLLLTREVPGLAAEERREVELSLDLPARFVEGRVVDHRGEPAAKARVRFEVASGVQSTTTDAEGAFRYGPILVGDEEPARVQASREGDAPSRPIEFQPSQAGALWLQLERPTTLEVRVRDADGRAVDVRRLDLQMEAYDLQVHPDRESEGRYQAAGLPPGEVQLGTRHGGVRYSVEGRSDEGPLELELPVHGLLRVLVPPRPGAERRSWSVSAVSVDGSRRCDWRLGHDAEGGLVGASPLLPGRYTVRLDGVDPDDPPDLAAQEIELLARTEVELRFDDH